MNKEELNRIIKSEGDYYEWTNTLKCFIQRNSMNSWCGYVVIPKTFPIDFEKEINLNCHGGVTYQSINTDGDLVAGFDCAHHGDLVPKLVELQDNWYSLLSDENSIYRDKQYVINEVNSMVEQILNFVSVKRHTKINNILKKN
jgi:hypothetical protein